MSRASVVFNLASFLEKPFPLSVEDLFLESYGSLPSVGVEIEVPWRSLIDNHSFWFNGESYSSFSPSKKQAFDSLCSKLSDDLLPKYKQITSLGVPRGLDKFYEFAHRPVNWYNVLAQEVSLLFDSGFIKSGFENPMHLTISDVKKSSDSGILALIVEFLGGSSPSRIKSSYGRKHGFGWQCKDRDSGLKQRSSSELSLNKDCGIEISTLFASDSSQVSSVLRSAQFFAWALRSSYLAPSSFQARVWSESKDLVLDGILKPNSLNNWWESPYHSRDEWDVYSLLLVDPKLDYCRSILRSNLDSLSNFYLESNKYKITTKK